MGPVCSQCKASDFDVRYIEKAITYIVHCTGCGHVVGVMHDHIELAKEIAERLTGGTRNQTGHPVVHIKAEEQVFG